MIGHITRATRILLFWSLMAVAVLLSATRILLAGLDNYQLELERKIREMSELPIRIGKLQAGMRGFNPEIILREINVEAGDPKNLPDIHLREIRLGVDFWDLLLTQDVLSSSRVTLVGAKISVTRNADGSFSIKGLQASDEQPLWLLQGGKYEILDSEITWQDLKRHGDPVYFDHFDLVLKNHYFDGSHEVHLVSQLPRQYGDSLRISALISGNIFEANDISGQLYIEGTDLQSSALVTGDLPLGLNLHSGAGDIRVWSLWRNSKPYQVDGYVQAQQISISKNQAPPLRMDTFQANFSWSSNNDRWRLAGYDVNIFTRQQRWPDGAFYLQQDAEGNISALIKQLDLPAAMFLAPLIVPAEHDYASWLKLNPRGRLRDLSLFVGHDLQNYALRGRFDDLSIEAYEAIPQIQHLSGEISTTDDYGQIYFNSFDARADISDLFRNPIAIKRLQGRVHWWQSQDAWQIVSWGFKADSVDFQTISNLNLLIPKTDASPILDMRTRFGGFNDISQAYKYLPAKIMNPGAVEWLDDAFVAGQVHRGEMLIRGALDQFPFVDGQGRFETVFTIKNGELQFNEQWPHLRDLYADVQFLGEDLQVAIAAGRSERVKIDQAVVTIPDLENGGHVYVWGQVRAAIANSLAFLQKSPLKPKIDPIADLLQARGETQVDLELKIPYDLAKSVSVDVNAHLHNAALTVKPIDLKVQDITGILNFTEDRVSSGPLQAKTLGYPIQGRLSSDEQATYLTIEGRTDIDNLEKQFAFLQNDTADGAFSYRTQLTLPYGTDKPGVLNIASSLEGVRVDGQGALAKTADQEKNLNLDFHLDTENLLPLTLTYGSEFQASLLIDKSRETLHAGHIVFGQGQARRYDKAGLKIDIKQGTFDLSQAIGTFSAGDPGKRPPLKELAIDTSQAVWQGQKLGALHCQLRSHDQSWQGSIDSAIAQGMFQIPDQFGGNLAIKLDMDFLDLSAMNALNFSAADAVITDLPLVEINSRQLMWRSVDLGRLQLQTERLPNGIHFKKLRIINQNGQIDMTGDWMKYATATNTQLKANLKMQRFGQLLSRLGYTDDIKETSADVQFQGGWRGAPYQFSMDRLNGQLQIAMKEGRISSIEPGLGRLLGLIAMEQWVKRLSLDFSDIYREGLAFDEINGRFKIKDGLAFTDDLTVDAVAATFKIVGFTNLVDKSIDQRVAVLPNSTDALPIAGTIVGGIASIITQVVTDDYKEGYFFGSQYQLSGPWGDVEVTPLHEEDGLFKKTWRGLTDFGWLDFMVE